MNARRIRNRCLKLEPEANVKMDCQASVPRDAFPPTPPGPEGSNGNGLLCVQWVAGAWLKPSSDSYPFPLLIAMASNDRGMAEPGVLVKGV